MQFDSTLSYIMAIHLCILTEIMTFIALYHYTLSHRKSS